MVGGGVVVRWCDGAMAGQMGMAENPAGGQVRSQRQRAAPRNRVIGGSRQCRNRVIGGLGGGSATALRSLRSRRGWIIFDSRGRPPDLPESGTGFLDNFVIKFIVCIQLL